MGMVTLKTIYTGAKQRYRYLFPDFRVQSFADIKFSNISKHDGCQHVYDEPRKSCVNLSDFHTRAGLARHTENIAGEVTQKGKYMLAVPIKFYESGRWEERGQSI